MRTETVSIFTFLTSLLCYGFLGFLWLLYDVQFSLAGVPSAAFPAVFATKVQTVAFASLLGAIFTALVVYFAERRGLTGPR